MRPETGLSLTPTHTRLRAQYLTFATDTEIKTGERFSSKMAHCNPGVEHDPTWYEKIRIDLSALKRRAADIGAKRCVKKDYQAAWLVRVCSGETLYSENEQKLGKTCK